MYIVKISNPDYIDLISIINKKLTVFKDVDA